MRSSYDPQIPPDRVIEENLKLLGKEAAGKDQITRLGERYFMFCHCGTKQSSAIEAVVTAFRNTHLENCEQE